MSIEKIDVLIIGCGPAGTSTALHLIRQDPSWAGRIVMIDQAVHPRDKLCGGGVTHMGQNLLARLGLRFEPQHLNIREVRLNYRASSIALHGAPVLRIVRRDEFDHWLVGVAEQLGVRIRQGDAQRVMQVKQTDDFVEVCTAGDKLQARVVVAADGARSTVRRALKWPGESRVARLLEVLTPENRQLPAFEQGIAEFDFTPLNYGLQGYTWQFPSMIAGQPYMNRGVFDSRIRPERAKADLKLILRELLARYGRDLGDYELKGYPLRWWDRDGPFAIPRVLLAGDAAGTDPLMGEGISFALGYGEVAAAAIVDAYQRHDYSLTTYADRLFAQPLFRQLDARTRLARLLYRSGSPLFVGLIWHIVRWRLQFGPWRRQEFTKDEEPSLSLSESNAARR